MSTSIQDTSPGFPRAIVSRPEVDTGTGISPNEGFGISAVFSPQTSAPSSTAAQATASTATSSGSTTLPTTTVTVTTTSNPSSSPSPSPRSGSPQGPQLGPIIGGVVAAVAILLLLLLLKLLASRRQREIRLRRAASAEIDPTVTPFTGKFNLIDTREGLGSHLNVNDERSETPGPTVHVSQIIPPTNVGLKRARTNYTVHSPNHDLITNGAITGEMTHLSNDSIYSDYAPPAYDNLSSRNSRVNSSQSLENLVNP